MKRRSQYYILIGILTLFIILALAVREPVETTAAQPTLYWGSRGSSVTLLQRKLASWGYYDGRIDGIYGSDTYQAVIEFQRKNRLRVDGIVGRETWAALGYQWAGSSSQNVVRAATTAGNTRSNDVEMLARLVHAEARAEPYEGQVAVAAVVLNRVKSPSFPNSISG